MFYSAMAIFELKYKLQRNHTDITSLNPSNIVVDVEFTPYRTIIKCRTGSNLIGYYLIFYVYWDYESEINIFYSLSTKYFKIP